MSRYGKGCVDEGGHTRGKLASGSKGVVSRAFCIFDGSSSFPSGASTCFISLDRAVCTSGLERCVTKLDLAINEWNVALRSSERGGLSGDDANSCSMAGGLGVAVGISTSPW
jgi:hypothetical protein